MQIDSTSSRICSPLWKIGGECFEALELNKDLPAEARRVMANIRALGAEESIYLRGSVLEHREPFPRADLDLFVIHQGPRPPRLLTELSRVTHRALDVKWLNAADLRDEGARHYVFGALLAHRSLHVCGPAYEFTPYRPGQEFCWRHWVNYCVAELPGSLSCIEPRSVLFFKRLVRCFGVIMLLRDGLFTRDVSACIDHVKTLNEADYMTLIRLREALEGNVETTINIRPLKCNLATLFDEHWRGGGRKNAMRVL